MKLKLLSFGLTIALTGAIAGPAPVASDVVIGDIDDLTGVYSDNSGVGGIEATSRPHGTGT
jgi:hypothetical protein